MNLWEQARAGDENAVFGGRLAQAGTGPATTIAATKYQSFRLTCGAGRIYRTEHKQGALSATRARYFV